MTSTPQEPKPRLLDLFCGAGGCTAGYQRAGFYVVGVDKEPQPNYCGDEFVQVDAIWFLGQLVGSDNGQPALYDAIHASPPCQAFSLASGYHPAAKAQHPNLVEPVRDLLKQWDHQWGVPPYVIENVEGAPLRRDLVLCGEMFGLRVHRHRVFECSGFFAMQPRHAPHRLKGALTNCHIEDGHARQVAGNYADHDDASGAMGIDWMSRKELAQAIPPAYTAFIGEQLIGQLSERQAA